MSDSEQHAQSTEAKDAAGTTADAQSQLNDILYGKGTADGLLARCRNLVDEIEQFRSHLKKRQRSETVEISHYRGVLKSEFKNLERLQERQHALQAQQDEGLSQPLGDIHISHDGQPNQSLDAAASLQNILSSSNLPFLECVWNAAKSVTGLEGISKVLYYGSEEKDARNARQQHASNRNMRSPRAKPGRALVDVVANKGRLWIKVSLVTNHRLIMDKAREGWNPEDSSDDDSADGSNYSDGDAANGDDNDDDAASGVPLVRSANAMLQAAAEIQSRTRRPRVRLLLPRLKEGETPAIDRILARLRAKGVEIDCDPQAVLPLSLHASLPNMVPNPFAAFTPTLNIDCTILLGLVSDFSHVDVADEPWFHRALKRQLEVEERENLLPALLYPAIAGHELVCTVEAARRMREIVATIGTAGEKARTEVFLPPPPLPPPAGTESFCDADDGAERRACLEALSKFPVPADLHLPVRIVVSSAAGSTVSNQEDAVENQRRAPEKTCRALPPWADKVSSKLTSINQSVFMHGWAGDITTVTSNRGVVRQLERVLDEHAERDDEWPRIWLCPTARSLVGKEKDRKS